MLDVVDLCEKYVLHREEQKGKEEGAGDEGEAQDGEVGDEGVDGEEGEEGGEGKEGEHAEDSDCSSPLAMSDDE
eukprot:1915265-Prymnesium_polylepis.1